MSAATVTTPDLVVPVPDGWVVLDDSADSVVLAWPERTDGGFRANAVLTRRPSDEPVPVASADTIAATLALQREAQVLAVEVLPDSTVPGRLVTYVYESDETVVSVLHFVHATGTAHVHLTASCAIDDALLVHPHFWQLARSLEFTGAAS